MFTFYIYRYIFLQRSKLNVRGSKHYIWSCSSAEHTGEVVVVVTVL